MRVAVVVVVVVSSVRSQGVRVDNKHIAVVAHESGVLCRSLRSR